jgi:hypothetical protein
LPRRAVLAAKGGKLGQTERLEFRRCVPSAAR